MSDVPELKSSQSDDQRLRVELRVTPPASSSSAKPMPRAACERELLVSLAKQSPTSMAVFDREMRYLAASERWVQDTCIAADYLGKNHYAMLQDVPEEWKEPHRRGIAGETVASVQGTFDLKGDLRVIRRSVVPWGDEEEGGIVVLAEDSTDFERATNELSKREQLLSAILESTSDLILVKDLSLRTVLVNPATFEVLGKTADELLGKTDEEKFGDAAIAERLHIVDRRVLATGTTETVEEQIPTTNGMRTFLSTKSPMRNSNGEIIGLVAIARDITERKRMEEELYRAKMEWERTFDSVPDLISVIDTEHRILRVNRAMSDRLHCTRDHCAGKVCYENVHGESAPPGFCPHVQTLRDGQSHEVEVQDELLGGFFNISTTPLRSEDGKLIGSVHIARDITERKKAEQALIRSEKLASMGRMAATIAHEINNPLAAITNLLYLARHAATEDQRNGFLDSAEDELRRVAHITRQTLGFYREATAPNLTAIGNVLDSVLDLLRHKISKKAATVDSIYEDDLFVMGVTGELRQVFTNLISNSLDALGENGTIKIRARRTSACGRDFIRVTIADDGSGIAASHVPKLFEPFFSTKGSIGTGLGLWVSKQILDKHSATVRVRSKTTGPGKGTTFSVVFPAVENSARAAVV